MLTILVPPSATNLGVVIITFNPDDRFQKLITAIESQIQTIVVVDNASNVQVLFASSVNYNVHLIRNEQNMGIAAALNQGINFLQQKGYSWVLQFDQDSIPSYNFIQRLLANHQANNAHAALLGVGRGKLVVNDTTHFRLTPSIITSGSLLSIEAWNLIGPYREDFFIDGVDFEYALRLQQNNFVTGITNAVVLDHQLGSLDLPEDTASFLQPTNHSPLRRYYRARNMMLITRLYFLRFPLWVLKYHLFHSISLFVILVKEKNKAAKFKMIFKGVANGLTFKLNAGA